MNKVFLIGNLGKDPELKKLANDNQVCKFSLATSETYKKENGEKVTSTQWHNLTTWNGLAGVVSNYCKKGDKVAVEGKIEYRQWEGNDGNTRYSTEIVVTSLEMLGGKPNNNKPRSVEEISDNRGDDSDIPDFLKSGKY